MNIKTPQGSVTLLEPTVELLRAIRSFLPFGALRFTKPERGATFGLVMQCGETELLAVKRQPVDCDEQQSRISYLANSILIAHSSRGYLAHGFSGPFLPCAYLRPKRAAVSSLASPGSATRRPMGTKLRNTPANPLGTASSAIVSPR